MRKKLLVFSDLDLIFKVTPALSISKYDQNSLSAPYLLNQMMDFSQTLHIISLGKLKDLIRFWWPWPNFQGHHTIKTKMILNCSLFLTNVWIFYQICTERTLGQGKEVIRFWRPWPHFQGHIGILHVKFWPKNASAPYLLNQIKDSSQNLLIISLGKLKDLTRFWWPWPNFQGHHTLKTVQMSLVCSLFFNQCLDFYQTCTETTLRQGKEVIRFWRPWSHFQGHIGILNVRFWPQKLICTPSLEPNDGF